MIRSKKVAISCAKDEYGVKLLERRRRRKNSAWWNKEIREMKRRLKYIKEGYGRVSYDVNLLDGKKK